MRRAFAILALPAALSACHGSISRSGDDDADKDVHIAMNGGGSGDAVSVKIPGFDANVSLPNFDMGKHMDLDGIKLAPDTSVKNIDVVGHDHDGRDDGGHVQIAFSNPRAPAALVDYYRAQASAAGFEGITANGGTLAASKHGKKFALTVGPQGSGSTGAIALSGKD